MVCLWGALPVDEHEVGGRAVCGWEGRCKGRNGGLTEGGRLVVMRTLGGVLGGLCGVACLLMARHEHETRAWCGLACCSQVL